MRVTRREIAHGVQYWLPVVLWIVAILYLSSRSVLPAALSTSTPEAELRRRLIHAAEYGGLTLLLARALAASWRGSGQPLTKWVALPHHGGGLLISVLGFALFDEWWQSHIPHRDASLQDVGVDLLGAAGAWLLLLAMGVPLQGARRERALPRLLPPLAVCFPSPAKRLLDLLLASGGLMLSAPLWLLIALLVKLEDGGPVFDNEVRWGWGGAAFRIFKFRTVALRADQPHALPSPTGEKYFTRVGRFLRARGLDEIPQLLNIWWGEMSFVGPRPLAVQEIPAHLDAGLIAAAHLVGFTERLRVQPGLTGLAQVYGSKYLSHRHKFRYDRLYVARQSIWLDLHLLALSCWVTFCGRWERVGKKLR